MVRQKLHQQKLHHLGRQALRSISAVSFSCQRMIVLFFILVSLLLFLEPSHAFLGISSLSHVGEGAADHLLVVGTMIHKMDQRRNERTSCLNTATRLRYLSALWMGKGDGKKRRKKKSATSAGSGNGGAASAAPAPAPMRVTSDSNIPVRHQLVWAKMNKEYRKQQSNPGFRQKKKERTAYRRTLAEEELEQKAKERRRRGQDPDWDVILSRSAVKPLVIVDGYNIIFKWARLKKHMVKGNTAHARQLLIDDLENLASIKGWRIEVVFDGTRRNTVGPLGQGPGGVRVSQMDQESKKAVSKHGVRVVFSGVGMEADSYIEARCMQAKNVTEGELTSSFIVATDDALIRLAAQSAGAWPMSADRFVNELKASRKAIGYRVEAAVAQVNGHSIRPENLRNAPTRFGNSMLIVDKRNKTNPEFMTIDEYRRKKRLDDKEKMEADNGGENGAT